MASDQMTVTWSDEAAICSDCHRPFRISEEAITAQLAENAGEREDAIRSIEFCLGCVQGESPAGEYDVLGYYGFIWREEPKAWVILFCWKRTWQERSRQRDTGVTFKGVRKGAKEADEYVACLNRTIARSREQTGAAPE